MDYSEDYNQILADVQSILTALALEYLRSTYQFGSRIRGSKPTELEWVLLLQHVVDDLEQAIRYIAAHPVRKLVRDVESVRCQQLKRVDSAVRRAVQRGAGKGAKTLLKDGTPVREWLPEARAQLSLDTPEHRWLSFQLGQIRQRLATVRAATLLQMANKRRQTALDNLERMESRIGRLMRVEPLLAAKGPPVAGFASLQLLNAPGYKEAYQACVVLALGLRIESGPLQLSVKELSTLYEYWCYLATLRVLAEMSGHTVDLREMFRIKATGLEVDLKKGRASEVRIRGKGGRRIAARYNPTISGDFVLVDQKPDVLIAIDDPDWPQVKARRGESRDRYQGSPALSLRMWVETQLVAPLHCPSPLVPIPAGLA